MFGRLSLGLLLGWSIPALAIDVDESDFTLSASAEQRQQGDSLARTMVNKLGGMANYSKIDGLEFDFIVKRSDKIVVKRSHSWDKNRQLSYIKAKVKAEDVEVYINLATKTGRAFVSGQEVVEASKKSKLIKQGYSWWVNDSYWLVSPFKVFDPGVLRASINNRLRTTFDKVGLTPGDAYVYDFSQNGQLKGWLFRLQSGNRGKFRFDKPVKINGVTFFKQKISDQVVIAHGQIKSFKSAKSKRFKPLLRD